MMKIMPPKKGQDIEVKGLDKSKPYYYVETESRDIVANNLTDCLIAWANYYTVWCGRSKDGEALSVGRVG